MENRHREFIPKNVDELIRQTNYKLISACEQGRLISSVMRSRIENLPDLLRDVKHNDQYQYSLVDERIPANRVPIENPTYAYNNCIPEGCYPSNDSVDSALKLAPVTNQILPQPFFVKKSEKIQYDKTIPVYPMNSKTRGVFFMVNIIDFPYYKLNKRSGAEFDSRNLLHLFQEFGFICFSYENLTKKDFFHLLTELRTSKYLVETQCFVLTLMSHGKMVKDMHDRVEFYEGSISKVNEIEDFFSNEKCQSLRGKPKLFIFPFCRGKTTDIGVNRLQTDGFEGLKSLLDRNMPTRSDMLVCYASVRGFQTTRDTKRGSIYIQIFCRELAEHAHDTHIEDMLKIIGAKMGELYLPKGYLQTPAFYNHGFNKLLFFNPGVVE